MIPQIVDITETQHGLFYVTSAGMLCASFKTTVLDLENPDTDGKDMKLEFLLKQIPRNISYHFQLISEVSNNPPEGFTRSEAFKETGFLKQNLYVHFEITSTPFFRGSLKFLKSIIKREKESHLYLERVQELFDLIPFDLFENAGLALSPCTFEEVQSFFPSANAPIIQSKTGLVCNGEYIGALKLYKQASSTTKSSLASIRMNFPQPYTISTRVSKVSEGKLKASLNNGRRQEERLKGAKAEEKAAAKDQAIKATDNHGTKYLFIEMNIILKRPSEADLLKDIKALSQQTYSFGEFTQETADGCEQSFAASLPGGTPHLPSNMMEQDSSISCYLPMFAYGVSPKMPTTSSAFAYHRRDLSIEYHDISTKVHQNKMQNIFAKAGSGKSVMLNLMIESLAADPRAIIYIIDVAGSHVRTVQDLGGRIVDIDMNSQAPVNPFKHLKDATPSVISILRNCIIELLLDQGEISLPTAETFYVDDALLKYAATKPKKPSIPDFIKFIFPDPESDKTLFPKFPRKEHLLRFYRGIYKNIFSSSGNIEEENRIQYLNIKQISTATHSAIIKAAVASVLADFWIKVESKEKDEPIYFIVDEAPLIIASNFTSLTHQTTNTRKENGSLIVVSQFVDQCVVGGKTTLLSNAGTNIFLGPDDKLTVYQEALNLTPEDIEQIKRLQIKPGEYSQFFIKNSLGAHLGMILLGTKEYWKITSSPNDRALIENLQKLLPNLTANHIAQVIAQNQIGATT